MSAWYGINPQEHIGKVLTPALRSQRRNFVLRRFASLFFRILGAEFQKFITNLLTMHVSEGSQQFGRILGGHLVFFVVSLNCSSLSILYSNETQVELGFYPTLPLLCQLFP